MEHEQTFMEVLGLVKTNLTIPDLIATTPMDELILQESLAMLDFEKNLTQVLPLLNRIDAILDFRYDQLRKERSLTAEEKIAFNDLKLMIQRHAVRAWNYLQALDKFDGFVPENKFWLT